MADLQAGRLRDELNGADNGDKVSETRARLLMWEHRWELQQSLRLVEKLKLELGLYGTDTRHAAELIPHMVRDIMQGSVNGRLLRRAIESEQQLEAKRG